MRQSLKRRKRGKMLIDEKEYKYLIDRDKKLTALENGGVDNWEWYEESLKEYQQEKEREEKRKKIRDNISDEWSDILMYLAEGVYEPSLGGAGFDFRDESIKKAEEVFIDAILKYESERE